MCVPFALAVLLTLCAQATVTASTSYSFGTSNNISLASEPTAYTAGSWTEAAYPNTATTGQQIDCVAAVATITNICGNPGPGNSVSISIPAAPSGTLPTGNTNYLMVDGDPAYGAPVWANATGLTVNTTYSLFFYQASSEEDGNNKHYDDSWEVYVMPSATSGTYLCPQTTCGAQETTIDGADLAYTSPMMNNTGKESTAWELESFTFKATSTNEIIEFVTNAVAVGGGAFAPPLLALADVTLTTPEPGSWALVALGVGLVLFAARRRSAARG